MADDTKKVGISTGTPGFDLEGVSRPFQPVEDGSPEVTTPTDRGDMNVDHSVRDLPKKTRETLADYAGRKTSENRYPVDGKSRDVSLTTPNGVPSSLSENINTHRYAPRRDVVSGAPLANDPREALVDTISKGRTEPQRKDGNDLLRDAKGPEVRGYVSAVLKNNRFTVDRPLVSQEDAAEPSEYDPVLQHPKYGAVKASRLAQVGTALSLRASSEPGSQEGNPNSGRQQARSLLPGTNQLGATRVNVTLLRAKDVLDDLTSQSIPSESYISIGDKSWGALNNVQDPFSGLQAVGMIALSTAMTAAVVVAFEGVAALVNVAGSPPSQTRDAAGRYILGASSLDRGSNPSGISGLGNLNIPGNFTQNVFGLRPTTFPFARALRKGLEVFFGFEGSVVGGLKQSASSPGYNVVVARSIIRSSVQIVDTIKNAFRSSSVVSGVRNVISIAEEIRGSRLIAAMNVFAQLGDQALNQSDDDLTFGMTGEVAKVSTIDAIPDGTPGESVSKNRRSSGRTKLAWANNTTPSLYVLPTRILGMSLATKLGGHQTGYGLQEASTRSKYKLLEMSDTNSSNGRIPYSSVSNDGLDVKTIEQQLEAEYVPFYFHDLRTNEIISFHAFIAQLNESFNPEYEKTKALGRSDAVSIYKSTERNIDVRFHVVATSEDDFNDMWVKLNKFVTLVYPQYTQGRSVATEGYEFIQPFSQMMGAGPMIRLRIGDLVRSNYSRFGLARLFGVGSKDTLTLNNQSVDFKLKEDVVKQRIEQLKRTEQKNWNVSVDGISVEALGLNLPLLGGTPQGFAPTMSLAIDSSYVTVTIVQFVDNGESAVVQPQIVSPQDLVVHYGFTEAAARAKVEYLKTVYDNRSVPKTRIIGGRYKIPTSALRVSPMLARSVIDDLSSTVTTQDALDALNSFMSPEKNALVKSFESVKGKGLAGHMTNVSIDWMDKVTWETTPGSRAPKMCTIQFSFSPIHDIEPGLDHNGYNRAPIWPVGWFGQGIDDDKNGR